ESRNVLDHHRNVSPGVYYFFPQTYLVHTEGQLQNEEIVAHDGYATYL
ncbi:intraflagellar transport protein 25-like protein isoform d, partial [Daubentonia madagascariensis]